MLRTRRPYVLGWYALLALSILVVALSSSRVSAGEPNQRDAPDDAYLSLIPQIGAPSNGGTVVVGQRFVVELWVHGGVHTDLSGQQTYISFTNQIVKNAALGQITTTCTLTSTITPDNSVFDATLQNEVCNGTGPNGDQPCIFRGDPVDAGFFGYASGALSNCPDGCAGDFRVGQVALCAVAPGQASFHWLFNPLIPSRDTEIISVDGNLVHDPALFTDYTFTVIAPTPTNTSTPTRTATITNTGTPTLTRTNTPISSPTRTVTSTNTSTPTSTQTNTPSNTPMRTNTNTLTPTITNTPTPCNLTSNYLITQSTGAAIVPGTTDIGNHSDNIMTTIALPFAWNLYAATFTSVNVDSNGNLQFSSNSSQRSNVCLPTNTLNNSIIAHWDDLRTDTGQPGCSAYPTGCGIFTSVSGTAPNRIFNIEWRALYRLASSQAANFEVQLYESQARFDIVYGTIAQGGSDATVGVQNGVGPQNTQFLCSTTGLSAGLRLTFMQPVCATVTPIRTNTPTPTSTPSNTRTGTPSNTPAITNTPIITLTRTLTPTLTNTLTTTRTNTPPITSTSTNTGTITATRTSTGIATSTPCGTTSNYIITQTTGATIVPGTTDTGNHGDEMTTTIALPFVFNFYGRPFSSVVAVSNGFLQFTTADDAFINLCLPTNTLSDIILPYWDDVSTDRFFACNGVQGGCGIYTSISGVAPNRIFNIEWRTYYTGSPAEQANFEVRLYEGQGRIDFIYGRLDRGGNSATIGVQKDTGSMSTQFSCNTPGVVAGLQLTYTQPTCPLGSPTNTPTITPTGTRTNTPGPSSTPTVTEVSVINGHLTWQGVAAANRPSVTGTLSVCANGTPQNFNFATDTNGNFTISTNLANGTYNWLVRGGRHLATSSPADGLGLVISGGSATHEFGTQKGGNTNAQSDNVINSLDFNTLKAQYGHSGLQASDFDYNLVVNTLDFIIMKTAFGQAGSSLVCP